MMYYTHSNFFIVASLLVYVCLVSLSAACGPDDCIPSEDEGDMAAAETRCLLPDLQPPKFPDDK